MINCPINLGCKSYCSGGSNAIKTREGEAAWGAFLLGARAAKWYSHLAGGLQIDCVSCSAGVTLSIDFSTLNASSLYTLVWRCFGCCRNGRACWIQWETLLLFYSAFMLSESRACLYRNNWNKWRSLTVFLHLPFPACSLFLPSRSSGGIHTLCNADLKGNYPELFDYYNSIDALIKERNTSLP